MAANLTLEQRHAVWAAIPAKSLGCSKIFSVKSTDTVQQSFETLLEHNILSAPIYDESQAKYLGLVDFVDIVAHLVSHFKENVKEGSLQTWRDVIKAKNDFFSTPITSVSDLSHSNPLVSLPENSTLLDVMKVFAGAVHRVCLVDATGNLVSIVTQSSVVAYLSKHQKEMLPKGAKSLADLNLGIKKVFSIKERDPAIDGFKLMRKENVSSVAVLSDSGKIVGHLSARDLKGIKAQFYVFNKLFDPVQDLLKVIHNEELVTHVPVFTCQKSDTLIDVVQKVSVPRLHKIYVRDEHHMPLGVVTLTDIIAELLKD